MNRACQPDWFLLSVFYPYPGTELSDTCYSLGLIDGPADPYLERRRPVLDMPQFSKRQVGRGRDWFPLLIYRGHRPLKELLWLVSLAKIYSNRRLADAHRRLMERLYGKKGRDYRESPEMVFSRKNETEPDGGEKLVDAGAVSAE